MFYSSKCTVMMVCIAHSVSFEHLIDSKLQSMSCMCKQCDVCIFHIVHYSLLFLSSLLVYFSALSLFISFLGSMDVLFFAKDSFRLAVLSRISRSEYPLSNNMSVLIRLGMTSCCDVRRGKRWDSYSSTSNMAEDVCVQSISIEGPQEVEGLSPKTTLCSWNSTVPKETVLRSLFSE